MLGEAHGPWRHITPGPAERDPVKLGLHPSVVKPRGSAWSGTWPSGVGYRTDRRYSPWRSFLPPRRSWLSPDPIHDDVVEPGGGRRRTSGSGDGLSWIRRIRTRPARAVHPRFEFSPPGRAAVSTRADWPWSRSPHAPLESTTCMPRSPDETLPDSQPWPWARWPQRDAEGVRKTERRGWTTARKTPLPGL